MQLRQYNLSSGPVLRPADGFPQRDTMTRAFAKKSNEYKIYYITIENFICIDIIMDRKKIAGSKSMS